TAPRLGRTGRPRGFPAAFLRRARDCRRGSVRVRGRPCPCPDRHLGGRPALASRHPSWRSPVTTDAPSTQRHPDASSPEARLRDLGLDLPQAAPPVAAYVPVVVTGNLAHVSGQLPFVSGELVTGRLGEGVTLEQGMEAARACGLMILAQLRAA